MSADLNPWSYLVPSVGTSLVTYATLAPGARQSGIFASLEGTFHKGHIRGTFFPKGQGTSDGYPGIRLHSDGVKIDAWLFRSTALQQQWPYLDVYEGDEYARLACPFIHATGALEWSEVYVLAREHPKATPCPFNLPGLAEPPIGADGEHDLALASAPSAL